MNDGKCKAYFGPKSGDNHFFAAGALHPFDAAFIFPGVDERAVDWRLLRKDVCNLLED